MNRPSKNVRGTTSPSSFGPLLSYRLPSASSSTSATICVCGTPLHRHRCHSMTSRTTIFLLWAASFFGNYDWVIICTTIITCPRLLCFFLFFVPMLACNPMYFTRFRRLVTVCVMSGNNVSKFTKKGIKSRISNSWFISQTTNDKWPGWFLFLSIPYRIGYDF